MTFKQPDKVLSSLQFDQAEARSAIHAKATFAASQLERPDSVRMRLSREDARLLDRVRSTARFGKVEQAVNAISHASTPMAGSQIHDELNEVILQRALEAASAGYFSRAAPYASLASDSEAATQIRTSVDAVVFDKAVTKAEDGYINTAIKLSDYGSTVEARRTIRNGIDAGIYKGVWKLAAKRNFRQAIALTGVASSDDTRMNMRFGIDSLIAKRMKQLTVRKRHYRASALARYASSADEMNALRKRAGVYEPLESQTTPKPTQPIEGALPREPKTLANRNENNQRIIQLLRAARGKQRGVLLTYSTAAIVELDNYLIDTELRSITNSNNSSQHSTQLFDGASEILKQHGHEPGRNSITALVVALEDAQITAARGGPGLSL